MLGIPAPTPLDLTFRLFGIPIRISPFFWLLAVVVGMALGRGASGPESVPIIAGCVALSVLVHELGHGLTARLFGDRPRIVLHGLGGVCVSDRARRSFGPRMLIIVMGPVAGLLLGAASIGLWAALVAAGVAVDPRVELALTMLLLLNLIYSLFNLVPVWPLDGGQLVLTMLDHLSPRHGARRAHIASFLVAGTAAALAAAWAQWFVLTLVLGYYAFLNYMLLSHYHRIAMAEREGL